MRRLVPDSLAARTLLVLFLGLMVSHVLSVSMYFTDRTSALLFTGGEHIGERIATIDRLVRNAAPIERQRIVELADSDKLHVIWDPDSFIDDRKTSSWQAAVLYDALTAHLDKGSGEIFRLLHAKGTLPVLWQERLNPQQGKGILDEALLVSLRLQDGSWLNFAAPVQSPEPFWSLRFVLSMVVMLAAVAIFSALIVRHLTRPLATFAHAAERLGVDVKAPPLPETGPAEVRQAAHAFNEMQGRLRRFLEDRTQMVAAISHDLGTPITRLRLRAEFIEDEEQKTKMLADLEDMERMVKSALSFARDDASCEPRARVDLRTLLQRVCDDLSDGGHEVALTPGETTVPYACRPTALRRALTNLVENAVKYGERARVSLQCAAANAVVTIDDDGPGIPEDLRDEAFKPFGRLETSRSRETGGTGLGMTVARTIIRAHGGEITLTNRSEGGLRVEVILPR